MIVNTLHWTVRDLEIMPDEGGWKRHEIIDGELIVTRAPHIQHQGAAMGLGTLLEIWSKQTGLGRAFQTPGIVFSSTDAVIPDLVWISHDRLAQGIDEAGHLTIAPELIIEILSPGDQNQRRDRELKLKLYSIHGVQEYWIVSWQQQTIEVYRRSDTHLQLTATLLVQDTLSSPLLPEFSAPLQDIF
jgi:Uma2 family endonuclease